MRKIREELTDRDLRVARLTLADPYTQEGLVWEIPQEAMLRDILNVYEFERWPSEKVYCVNCKSHKHKRGFTAELDCGGKIFLGSKCGEELFGESWAQAERRLRDRRRRQHLLLRLDELLPKLPVILAGLNDWKYTADRLVASRKRFGTTMGSLFAALETAAGQHDGRLVLYERIRDLTVEETSIDNEATPRWKWIERVVHVMQGAKYFTTFDPVHAIESARELLLEIKHVAQDSDQLSTPAMRQYEKRLRDAVSGLDQVMEVYRSSLSFFQNENLRAVAAWATQTNHVDGQYEVRDGKLFNIDDGKAMELPPSYPAIDELPLRILRAPEDYHEKVA